MTVYGFHNDKMTLRKTCHMWMQLWEDGAGRVKMELETSSLVDGDCIHRDKIESMVLEEEKDQSLIAKDNLFFKNLEAIESVLTIASFDEQGVAGTWKVTQDDWYESHSHFKDFFKLQNEEVSEHTESYVNFEIMNYDYLGPELFHEDHDFDKLRDGSEIPSL